MRRAGLKQGAEGQELSFDNETEMPCRKIRCIFLRFGIWGGGIHTGDFNLGVITYKMVFKSIIQPRLPKV